MTVSPESQHLGPIHRTYKVNWTGISIPIVGLLAFAGICAALIIYDRSVGGGIGTTICLGIFGLPALLYAIILAMQAAQVSAVTVDLYQGGINYRSGASQSPITWDDIETVWLHINKIKVQGIPVRVGYDVKLRLVDGRTLSIPRQLGGAEELAAAIGQAVAAHKLPAMLERIQTGEQLEFGKYRLTRDELIAGEKRIPWEKRPAMSLYGSSVMLHAKGDVGLAVKSGFASNPMRKIPNLYLLFALVDGLSAQAQSP